MPNLEKLRLLVGPDEDPRRVCKLMFVDNDASIYVIPYAANRRFYCGGRTFGEMQTEDNFDFTEGLAADLEPKLSIHESGRVQVMAGGTRLPELQIPRLDSLRGQHVATIHADRFSRLPRHTRALRQQGREQDHLVPVDPAVEGGRFAIYVNGERPEFAIDRPRLTLTLRRPTLERPLFVGVAPIAQEDMGGEDRPA